jgi:hypothetical protein
MAMRDLVRLSGVAASVAGLLLASMTMPMAAGALAIGACGAYGHAYDFADVQTARAAALKNCPGHCKQVVTAQKSCVALAVDGRKPCGPPGYANASRLGAAQNAALKLCYKRGGKACVIRAWICDAKG